MESTSSWQLARGACVVSSTKAITSDYAACSTVGCRARRPGMTQFNIHVPDTPPRRIECLWSVRADGQGLPAAGGRIFAAYAIHDRVQDELLYREALALSLDKDDIIIRRRLRQTLQIVSEDLSAPEPPSEAQLP